MVISIRHHVAYFVGGAPFFDVVQELQSVFEGVGTVGEGCVVDLHGVADGFPVCGTECVNGVRVDNELDGSKANRSCVQCKLTLRKSP